MTATVKRFTHSGDVLSPLGSEPRANGSRGNRAPSLLLTSTHSVAPMCQGRARRDFYEEGALAVCRDILPQRIKICFPDLAQQQAPRQRNMGSGSKMSLCTPVAQ